MEEWLKKISEISSSKDSSGLPLYQRLIESISQIIADGRMPDAMRLPPDTIMAAQLGISHITWAKVLNELRKRGVVERSRQRGTFIRKPRRSRNQDVAEKNTVAVFMDTITCIKHRRSIRSFQQKPVETEVLTKIVEAAAFAPSWKNTQTSRYIVITDPALKSRIAAEATLGYAGNSKIIENAPALVVQCSVAQRAGYERDGSFSTSKEDRSGVRKQQKR